MRSNARRRTARPVTSSTTVGRAILRGRPRPRRTATTWPSTRNSPPQTPNGSPRSRARARHSRRTVQRAQIAFARAASAGFSEKNSGVYVERGSAQRAALAITASTGCRRAADVLDVFMTACIGGTTSLALEACPAEGRHRSPRLYEGVKNRRTAPFNAIEQFVNPASGAASWSVAGRTRSRRR